MREHSTYETALALAGANLVLIAGALSVSVYDWPIVAGISVLAFDIPLLVGFGRWTPTSVDGKSSWHDWVAVHVFIAAAPLAVFGISLLLVHVHAICGVLFALSTVLAFVLYKRRLHQLDLLHPSKA